MTVIVITAAAAAAAGGDIIVEALTVSKHSSRGWAQFAIAPSNRIERNWRDRMHLVVVTQRLRPRFRVQPLDALLNFISLKQQESI